MLHHKLKMLRKERGLSQHKVADAIHLTQNAYSNIETGKTKIDIDRLKKLAEFYNKQLTELLEIPDIVFDTNNNVTKLITDLEEQLKTKDDQIKQLLWENKELILQMKNTTNKNLSLPHSIGDESKWKGMAMVLTPTALSI
jgi:transcriptional regulator with XRE-family HTH domain